MKRMQLGSSTLRVSRIALGCMRLSEDRAQAMAAVHAALDQGIDFFDHADIYGRGQREATFSHIWQELPGLRDRVFIQSKCGIRFAGDPDERSPARYDFSAEHILRSVEGSLQRLKTDYLDVLLLHRPDALVEPEEVARAFDELEGAGKVRWFGVSNHTAGQIDLLKTCVRQPLVANQLELNPVHAQLIDDGIVFNRDDLGTMSRSEGTLPYCRINAITVQAWSPLARGVLSGKEVDDPDGRVGRTAALVAELADEKNVRPEAILIAWLLRHPAGIQAVIGTTNPQRIAATCKADDVELSRVEWYRLFEAGRGRRVP